MDTGYGTRKPLHYYCEVTHAVEWGGDDDYRRGP